MFLFLNLYIFRGLFYNYFTLTISGLLGVILYLFMLLIALLGYSLSYGLMSYWGATVITNFISVIPFIGEDINIGSKTLKRFYVLHYLYYSYWFNRYPSIHII